MSNDNQASAPSVQVVPPKGHDPLADFQEGQWWIKELDAFARQDFATNDQKRAVAVVHNLLRAAQASALQAAIPAQPVAWVPRAIKDSPLAVAGEFAWDDLSEHQFQVRNTEYWECAALYASPTAQPAASQQTKDVCVSPSGPGSPLQPQAASAAIPDACEHCNDGDGFSVFPYYGVAPHTHAAGPMVGSTRLLPKDQWGDNFREDPECPGQGVYLRCPKCGAGERA